MKHHPLVLICDPDPEIFLANEHCFLQIKNVPVTIVRVGDADQFLAKLNELVSQGNFPDVVAINAGMRDSHRQMIEGFVELHTIARADGKIKKDLPPKITFYAPFLEQDTYPPESMGYVLDELDDWWEERYSGQSRIRMDHTYEQYAVDSIYFALSDLYEDRSRRFAIDWHENPIDKKPVVVLCNDSLEYLSSQHHRVRLTWGDNVEVIIASSYIGFYSQLNTLINQGNFPDFFTADASLHQDVDKMILLMAAKYHEAKQAGKIGKPWPEHIYIHSADNSTAIERLPRLENLKGQFPEELQGTYKVSVGEYTPDFELNAALTTLYPNLESAPEDYFLKYPDSKECIPSDPETRIRSYLEDYFYRILPEMEAETASKNGIQCQSGFGSTVSGFVAYTTEDMAFIEQERGHTNPYSQDTILVVEKFDERLHGPFLPRIKGIVICDPDFEPHIPIALQNFGVSALVGADFTEIQETFPAIFADHLGNCPTPMTLNIPTKMISDQDQGCVQSLSLGALERWFKAIQAQLRQNPQLSTRFKIQADHRSQLRTPFSHQIEGVGLIRSERFISGNAAHYDAAIAAMTSTEDGLPIRAWQEAQYASLHEMLGSCRNSKPVCYRLADFGTGAFLPKEEVECLQQELGSTLLPQGVQFALKKPQIYKGQLRAVFRAAVECRISSLEILIPQVQSAYDVLYVQQWIEEVLAEEGQVQAQNFSIGSMIETNEALEHIIEISGMSSFLCVGMNDLVQVNQKVSRQWKERQEHLVAQGFDPYRQVPQHILEKVSGALHSVQEADIRLCGEFASTVDGLLFANDNKTGHVVVTPTQQCVYINPIIAEEILWRQRTGKTNPPESTDPIMALYLDLGMSLR